MIFLTQFNCQRLINECLSLIDTKKIQNIDTELYELHNLNLNSFPYWSRDKIIICHLLLNKSEIINLEIKPLRSNSDDEKYIFSVGKPAYHSNIGCLKLHKQFSNILVPSKLPNELRPQYKEYYLQHYSEYGRGKQQKDPRNLARQIIKEFGYNNLFTPEEQITNKDLIQYWVDKYFNAVIHDNSGILVFQADSTDDEKSNLYNKEILTTKLQNSINKLNEMIENEKDEDIKCAYIFLKDKTIWNKPAWEYHQLPLFTRKLDDDDREKFREIATLQNQVAQNIIKISALKLVNQGFNLSEEILIKAGFRACKSCCK
ncbi:hypothetical protein QG085_04465 [Kingella kingae]|uniref:hypothetical protein n=1 Tax=Kingella kingae TaxID=504 RepID=UPI00050A1CF0|nr:hypothetical protein [Kingella kingae]MDK4566708.1 hypothetical protein [Kingella kingae]MDK4628450.1 hypothetical protein [Kingella kingae]MDK4636318.1 hypothetical protein [Kingella kingae]MDK4638328.1 hypothetical protein [Kingella kingae]